MYNVIMYLVFTYVVCVCAVSYTHLCVSVRACVKSTVNIKKLSYIGSDINLRPAIKDFVLWKQ